MDFGGDAWSASAPWEKHYKRVETAEPQRFARTLPSAL
jgi:hypothetical protein